MCVLNTNEQVSSLNIIVQPNPANDFLKIKVVDELIKKIALFDISRKQLMTSIFNTNETSVDVSDLSSGIYFIKLNGSFGVKVTKFIKN